MNGEHRPIRVATGGPEATEVGRPAPGAAVGVAPAGAHTPLIDIHEAAEGLVLEADLPGASEQALVIQLEDNILSIHARVEPPVPEGTRPIHQEYRVGDFYRSFILSDEVDRDRIGAELKNGVLRLVLPKSDRARTRRIKVKSQ